MAAKPNVLVLVGYGINCNEETRHAARLALRAFKLQGAKAEEVHINQLINREKNLRHYQVLALPGGFSYGDHISSAIALVTKIRSYLWQEVLRFIENDKLIIGICNGFQVLVKLGLLPAPDNRYGKRVATLAYNGSSRFEDRWVRLTASPNQCVFTRGIERLYIPVAHGEGRFVSEPETVDSLFRQEQVVFQYADKNYAPAKGNFPDNPNASIRDIAGVTDPTGRIFGLMPHPERFLYLVNHPDYALLKEKALREGKIKKASELPEAGEGRKIFENCVAYFR